MKKISMILLLSAVSAAHAFAADESFYVGANVGSASSDYPGSTSPLAFALQGGYQFNKNFAFEGQYASFGNIAPAGSMNPTGISGAGVGTLPISDRFGVYGKLGLASIQTKISGSGIFGVDGTYRKNSATYGVGGQYNFTPQLGIRFGADRYSTGGSQNGFILNNGTLTVYSVGIIYNN